MVPKNRKHDPMLDAEYLLDQLEDGSLKVRVGQIWKPVPVKGTTILQLDLDNCARVNKREIGWRLHLAGVKLKSLVARPSPSKTGWHVAAWIHGTYNRWQIIALQSICESDPCREARNFRAAGQAAKEWRENWQVLFQ